MDKFNWFLINVLSGVTQNDSDTLTVLQCNETNYGVVSLENNKCRFYYTNPTKSLITFTYYVTDGISIKSEIIQIQPINNIPIINPYSETVHWRKLYNKYNLTNLIPTSTGDREFWKNYTINSVTWNPANTFGSVKFINFQNVEIYSSKVYKGILIFTITDYLMVWIIQILLQLKLQFIIINLHLKVGHIQIIGEQL